MPAPSRKLTPLAGASKPPLQPPILRPKQLALPAARGADVRVDLPADSKLAEGPEPPPSREVPEGLAAPPHGTTPSMPPASDEDTSVDRTDTAGDESPVNKGSGENDPPSSLVQGGSSTDPAGAPKQRAWPFLAGCLEIARMTPRTAAGTTLGRQRLPAEYRAGASPVAAISWHTHAENP